MSGMFGRAAGGIEETECAASLRTISWIVRASQRAYAVHSSQVKHSTGRQSQLTLLITYAQLLYLIKVVAGRVT